MSEGGCQDPGAGGAPGGDAPASRRDGGGDPASSTVAVAHPLRLDQTPRRTDRCAWQVVEGEAVLLDLEGRMLLGLNAVGSFLWPLVDGARTVAQLGDAVAAAFGVEPGRARDDAARFLLDLQRRGLVQP